MLVSSEKFHGGNKAKLFKVVQFFANLKFYLEDPPYRTAHIQAN